MKIHEIQICLLSQLSDPDKAKAIVQLEKIADVHESLDFEPHRWRHPRADALLAIYRGRVIGGMFLKPGALIEPLLMDPQMADKSKVWLMLGAHMQGLLLREGLDEVYFTVPEGEFPEYEKLLQRRGFERLDVNGFRFYRHLFVPESILNV